MSLKSIIIMLVVLSAFMYFLVARVLWRGDETPAASATTQSTARQSSEPQLISDVNEVPAIAEGPGKDVYVANCNKCHSLRYVLMQPKFNRKVWASEVTKMVNAYKATIDAAQQAQIVDYLVAAYGVADKKT